MSSESTKKSRKERILDAAEELFSEHGFDGVTLRNITTAANVDVALVNYHFGPKRDLFDAVLNRRAEVLNQVRSDALDACLLNAGDGQLTVEDIIHAYLAPMGEIQGSADEGWRHYFALIAYVNNSPEFGREVMSQYFNPLVSRFIEALRKALPDADDEALYWGYHYLSGALTLTMADTGRLDTLSNGLAKSADAEKGYAHMIPFIAAGFRAICAR
ncbi:TetR family transcriptional regulator [Litorimonas cladophorae]|uniref:TetR family transcriptional regulator n=1 Tax=Litorimonas cladophorae TaxID=1220491 RepID=A0A918NIT1_9PROT|nr:TetR/AcrR family transcriptional regulator [Litorimonas cladophorae]GGX73160.1 TetR family transcriptional regulator [Litorimonas cladophorae]